MKVPNDYFEAAHEVNSASPYDFKVQYLPYGVINSPGWSQYPKWKFIGNDITTKLFNKPVLTPATFLNFGKFNYGDTFGKISPEAYERLLLDVMDGDATLFMRRDAIEQSWTWVTPILKAWRQGKTRWLPEYRAGTWGPPEADRLIQLDGRQWRVI